MAPARARSIGGASRPHAQLYDEDRELDGVDVEVPRGGRRWWPDETRPAITERVRRDVHLAIKRRPVANNFSSWQMNFPHELPNGKPNPICSLGECGDPTCPTYRPKHPEVREAVEACVLEKCQGHFRKRELQTYASVGSGLMAQDWVVLEKLRDAGMLPCRAIFVELRTARPVMTCEGADFPRLSQGGGMNLRQTGFTGDLGPEFAFAAIVKFEKPTNKSYLFDFANGENGEQSIFAEVGGPDELGLITFGIREEQYASPVSVPIKDCWEPGKTHNFLFSMSATGSFNVFKDGQMIARAQGRGAWCGPRKHLWVGQSSSSRNHAFKGRIQKIKVWDQEVDAMATEQMFSSEVESAFQNISQWYSGELAVWSFGSLASYAAACEKDERFAANLLVKLDVHDELDGYDDFVCKALGPEGLALTLGGPGRSWRRSGTGWIPVDTTCKILDDAESKTMMPWAFMGAFPGDQDRQQYFTKGRLQRADCSQCRRGPGERRPGRQRERAQKGRLGGGTRTWRRSGQCAGRGQELVAGSQGLNAAVERSRTAAQRLEDLLDDLALPGEMNPAAGSGLLAELDELEQAEMLCDSEVQEVDDSEEEDVLPGLQVFDQTEQRA